MTETPPDALADWCTDAGAADAVAALFVAHADPSYISHSELQIGRATDLGTWAADLDERVRRLAVRAAVTPQDAEDGIRLATLSREGRLVGLAFVAFSRSACVPYATLEDLLIAPEERGRGSGNSFVEWIVDQCRSAGIRRMFLESGAGNHRAHDFFAREHFRQISIVMMRDL